MVTQEQGLLSRIEMDDGPKGDGAPPDHGGRVLDLGPLGLVR